ncbi:MAG: SRPBCC family protein [Alphaproteobacteria bacterium]
MNAQAKTSEVVRITKLLPASPEQVFDAWTDPESLAKWFLPGPVKVGPVEVDLRIGGRYRIVVVVGEAEREHWGEYLEIERPDRLVFTWFSDNTGGGETLVTIEFKAHGSGTTGARTELILTHEQLPDRQAAMQHEAGWTNILDALGVHLTL